MALWPFNRKKKDTGLPEEVEEYYEATRGRGSSAWLLAAGTLILTLVLAAGLFFAGRWVYDRFSNDEPEQTPAPVEQTTPENAPQDTTESSPNDEADNNSADTDEDTSSNPETQPLEGDESDNSTDTEIPATGPGPNGLQ